MSRSAVWELLSISGLTLIVTGIGFVWLNKRRQGESLTYAAANGDTVRVSALIAEGVDPNTRGRYGDTALMYAVFDHRAVVAKILLEAGADVNAQKSADGSTALTQALLRAVLRPRRALATVRLLLENGADVSRRPGGGRSAYEWAVRWESRLETDPHALNKTVQSAPIGLPDIELGVSSPEMLTREMRELIREILARQRASVVIPNSGGNAMGSP